MKDDSLTVFYDAGCAVCSFEIDALCRRDSRGRLRPIDISAPGFDAARDGFEAGALDAAIHVVAGDGRVARGTDALRLLYRSVGLGWLVAPTAWPGLRQASDIAYRLFARHRRRCSRVLAPVIAALRGGARGAQARP
jgi:predicted DCC family thiol-disulfide oxidoreductase YuxK